ncbi:MAG: neuraminidase-like domain-containing protein [Candidatus Nitrotoga sp.]|nr:neuraminidase-like domain-containing protein [Candidatus Nitrotoga sp.]
MKDSQFSDISEVIAQHRPDFASLFGSLELCDCQHCRSVYSPAAYLVDLLQFLSLGLAPNNPMITPLDILVGSDKKIGKDGRPIIGRRPDIAHIALSCENTNTTLPYVDLVNEVLESYIIFTQTLPLQIDKTGNLIPRPNESSLDVTAAELAANPENTGDQAYDRLEAAVFPFNLPFNQPITALRLTLEKMRSSRYEVMNVFGSDQNDKAEVLETKLCALDVEALKLTEREFAILTGQNFAGETPIWPGLDWGVSDFYGFKMSSIAINPPWVAGNLPVGAQQQVVNDAWIFAAFDTPPESGVIPHASRIAAGLHQHFFNQVSVPNRLNVEPEDFLYTEIFLDPVNIPQQVMLQWLVGESWEHRAYWGKSKINWGIESTASRRYMGPLPTAGKWVRLEVPAALIGLAGREVSGLAFTLFDGGATWGAAGKRSSTWVEQLTHVPILLARTGVTYVELIDLVRTNYVNSALPQGEALASFQRIPISYGALGRLVASDFADANEQTIEALNKAGMTLDELRAWVKEHFEAIGKMLVLDAPDSACDLTITWLQHLDGTMLSEDDLSRLHRFIRLWRKLGWAIPDIDRAITALQAPDINRNFLRQLGQIVQWQDLLQLPVQQLLSFWGVIPTSGDKSLYSTLFLNKAVREIDPVFTPINSEFLTDLNLKIKDHLPALLAAFRTRASDLALIRAHTGLDNDAPLTLATVTILYRYVTLARALELAVKDLIDLEVLSGVAPFSKLESNVGFSDINPARTIEFVRLADRVKQSGFIPETLNYLLNKVADAPPALAPNNEQIHLALTTLTEGLIRIAAENVITDDPTGEITRAKLSLLFEAHLVEQIARLISGTQIFSASLEELPNGVVMPTTGKVTYDKASKSLKVTGWFTDEERDNLLTLSNVAEYTSALTSLHQQSLQQHPDELLQKTLQGQLRWTNQEAAELEKSVFKATSLGPDGTIDPTIVAGKFKAFLTVALPYIRVALSRALVKQTLADALTLEPATAAFLLEGAHGIVPLQGMKKEDPVITNFLALTGNGLTASYFEDENLEKLGEKTVDPAINFRWDSKKGFSVRWEGKLLADKTQRYQFHLRAGGGVQFKVDGELLIDQWKDAAPAEYTYAKNLEAGKFYDLIIEYFNHNSAADDEPAALVELRWSGPSSPAEIVPQYRLFSSGDAYLAAQKAFIQLHKASVLSDGFKLSPRELAYLAQPKIDGNPAHPNAFDLNDLPVEAAPADKHTLFSAWSKWNDFVTLRALARNDPDSVLDVISAETGGQAQKALLRATGWDVHMLTTLVGNEFTLKPSYNDVTALLKLANAMRLLGQLGAPANEVFGWASIFSDTARVIEDGVTKMDTSLVSETAKFNAEDLGRVVAGAGIPDATRIIAIVSATEVTLNNKTSATATGIRVQIYGDNKPALTAAQEAKRAHKAQYDNAAWLEIARPIADQLREAQRAALVAYLLPRVGATDSGDLFDYFLIDVEMSPCMQTSRIKQAISSVQLFIQRCRMNLEPKVSPDKIDPKLWPWRKNYRVWEANLKVFLYPENWIEPELRDDKTQFFRELESELLQDEVTNETAEKALGNYLQKLETVSNLKICGMHEQTKFSEGEKRQNVLHVFGHTFSTPRIFYYRQLVTVNANDRYWTSWEEVSLDIEADEVLPVIWNRRLYLFWQVLTEKKEKEGEKIITFIRLAFSEYQQGKWSAKRITADDKAMYRNPDMSTFMDFKIEADELKILLATEATKALRQDITGNTPDFFYARSVFNNSLKFLNSNGLVESKSAINKENFYSDGFLPIYPYYPNDPKTYTFFNLDVSKLNASIPVFELVPENGLLTFSRGFLPYTLNDRFFLQEGPRAYLVIPASSASVTVDDMLSQIDANQSETLKFGVYPNATLPKVLVDMTKAKNSWASGKAGVAALELKNFYLFPEKEKGKTVSSEVLTWKSRAFLQQVAGSTITAHEKNTAAAAVTLGAGKPDNLALANVRPFDAVVAGLWSSAQFRFETFFHPYAAVFQQRLHRDGISALLNINSQRPEGLPVLTSFKNAYNPNRATVNEKYWPEHKVDFDRPWAYSQYNWELFFHAPLLIATWLSKNQRFEEAMTWFHFIFDPTASGSDPKPQRYWNVLPLRNAQPLRLDDMLKALNAGDLARIGEWEDLQAHPFEPHRVARWRVSAYQKAVVMKYIDNLIDWGDQLFRRDTLESINEATQLYIIAAKLLGSRPQKLPERGRQRPQTFAQLRVSGLDKINQAMVKFENDLPFTGRATTGESATELTGLLGIGRTFYFCIPKNDKLLGYWDTVADRLFKIRHCMNIEGIVRELPLFEPPIDPALLVRAAAQGIDLSSVLNDMSTPLPFYRFNTLLAKALELTNELRSLGAALLAALEKRDAEYLANMRTTHEVELLSLVKLMKQQQLTEAKTAAEALQKSREVTQARFDFYNNIPQRIIEETNQLNEIALAQDFQSLSINEEINSADICTYSEDFSIGIGPGPTGPSPTFSASLGRANIIASYAAKTRAMSKKSSTHSYYANAASILGGWKRRSDDWELQKNLASKELIQIDKQITAAMIRVDIAQQDLENNSRQIEQSKEIKDYLRNKFTNEDLYKWMAGGISTIFFQCYQMTYDLAKQAERCCRFELGLTTSNFVQFGAWDSQRKGLLAGERLYLQLKQMERAYLNGNRREFELTKHYSLVMNDPLALINLKELGYCEISLPEELFDIDYPGHFMRRIKSVSLTIPAVVGPYTGVNCTLTMLRDKTRIKSTPAADGYLERDGEEDDRFMTNWARMQAIATSSGQNDSGLFELNFRDERYLPFEGAGVISCWRCELSNEFHQFDYDTISDVVLHIKYTAREGGAILREAAVANLEKQLKAEESKPQNRLFSLRYEFPSEWQRLLSVEVAALNGDDHSQAFSLAKHLFPFMFQGATITMNKIELFGVPKFLGNNFSEPVLAVTLTNPDGAEVKLKKAADIVQLVRMSTDGDVGVKVKHVDEKTKKDADWTLKVNRADVSRCLEQLDDILVMCHYSVVMSKKP